MRIAFRTDASVLIGTGHVMRCLALADGLRTHGAECTFIYRPHTWNLRNLVTERGHLAVALPFLPAAAPEAAGSDHAAWLGTDRIRDAQDTYRALGSEAVDWLVVDHYALDLEWERVLRPACERLLVIDDLADRKHDCDLLLDQNLGRSADDYDGLLPRHTIPLIGPQYALLRPEFAQLRAESLARRANAGLKQLLITLGGVDKDNVTGQVLDALEACTLWPDLHITVVMGPNAPWLQQVQTQAATMSRPTKILVGVSDMARLMANADLAIGAAGGTAWERCALGLPSIVLAVANNQQTGASAMQEAGVAIVVKNPQQLQGLLGMNPPTMSKLMQDMRQASARIVDGLGISRVTLEMMRPHA